ncbi:metalloprotease [Pseudomonas sp. S04]|uniref:KPN_02809 family neutral zinc metallopeptidase n=1 Tax=unclassified Pseudomonas TaxID=196821 RepID=UPI00131F6D1A|nr:MULTISPECIES: neutral zinc metallopeptidase [unclassified Pseudomonas]QHD03317.1 metalloprotease [Pseudomonas sp. S04]QHF35802.1 metalloprotease [Pseudomonas sp. S19]
MLWNKARPSDNVTDTRKSSSKRFPPGKKLGIALGVAALSGVVALGSLTSTQETDPPETPLTEVTPVHTDDPDLAFVRAVLGDTEDTWRAQFLTLDQPYPEPTMILFEQGVASACGYASSAVGPFYCPDSQVLYLDLGFFRKMAQQMPNFGEFAQAYVIAHEIGHHVQTRLGLSRPFDEALAAGQLTAGDNGLEVRAELQADCLAGVWAHHAQQRLNWLEPGDLQAALEAAAVFGDDYQRGNQTTGPMPETFTHGTSVQRVRWFERGFEQGRIEQCDTFSANPL